jgi:GrpB-like predicted nucleotidyltransferase (UPF0157 family)
MERYGGGSIMVADYNPARPAMFEKERANLHTALGPLVHTIEHKGSTAVPGLSAKPIIDLLVGVSSLAEAQSIQSLTASCWRGIMASRVRCSHDQFEVVFGSFCKSV